MIKPTILLLGTLMLLNKASAQIEPSGQPDVKPDEASHLLTSAQGGNIYTANLFTGTSNVNIPIYDYQIDGLNLGISLGYTTSGIKVDQVASTAGLGWNINAASSIERIATGIDDEVCANNMGAEQQPGAWNAGIGNWAISNNNPDNNDVFIANLAGRQIKFAIQILGSTGSGCTTCRIRYVTYPMVPIKIELYYGNTLIAQPINYPIPNDDYHLFHFKITDENGNVFNFDQYDLQQKKAQLSTTDYVYQANDRWWASSVTTYTGAQIQYSYNFKNVNFPLYRSESITEQAYFYIAYEEAERRYAGMAPSVSTEIMKCDGLMRTLTQIKYPDGSQADFIYRSIPRKDVPTLDILERIDITHGYENAKNAISYRMNQSYLYTENLNGFVGLDNNSSSDPLKYRLFLNSVDRVVNNNTAASERYYTFTYDEGYLPPRLSPQQDYYGYYNNGLTTIPSSYNNLTPSIPPAFSIPYHNFSSNEYGTITTYLYGTNKTPDFNLMTHGTLKKVKNSLGGQIEFYYEQHQLQDAVNPKETYDPGELSSVNTYDGFRTQKIVYTDGVNSDNNRTTSYIYTIDSAYRFYTKLYFWYPTMSAANNFPVASNNYQESYMFQRKWLNSPVHFIDYFDGFNHGYSYVTEKITGYNNEIIEQTNYHFSNIMNTSDEPVIYGDLTVSAGKSKLIVYRNSSFDLTAPSFLAKEAMGQILDTRHYVGNSSTADVITKNEYATYSISYPYLLDTGTTTLPTNQPRRSSKFNVGCTGFINNEHSVNVPVTLSTNRPAIYFDIFYRDRIDLKKHTTTNYSGATMSQSVFEYEYDASGYLTKTKWKDSKGDNYYTDIRYANNKPFKYIANTRTCLWTGTNNDWVLSYNEKPVPNGLPYSINTYSSLKASGGVWANDLPNHVTVDKEFTLRDNRHNALEIKYEGGLKYSSNMWDTRIGKKVAGVDNAHYADVAYTSFEGFSSATTTVNADDNGKWYFNNADVIVGGGINPAAVTGKNLYKLKSTNNLTTGIPDPTKSYVLSFWATVANVSAYGNNIPLTVAKMGAGNFRLFTAIIPANPFASTNVSYNLSITASNGLIDEVRLYPVGAAMTTYTYDPLFGLSSQCDEQNNITTMEYDGQGRLWRVKDVKGSILSQTTTSNLGPNN